MRYWLVVNEMSAGGKSESEAWRQRLAQAGVEPVLTRNIDDSWWVEEIESGDCILAAGGDGSVNLAAGICIERNAVLGVLPSGTANDFARNLGLPRDPEALCQLIARNKWRWLDVARYDRGLFLNVAHVGLGTAAVRGSGPKQKARWGRFVYALTILRRLREHRGFHATVTADTGEVDGRWLSLAVATGAYYGGGHPIPAASADDGQLDIIAVRPRSFLRLFATFIFMRLRDRSPDQTSTFVHLKARQCKISTHTPRTVTADGEVVANTPLEVRCDPGSLAVICEKIVHTRAKKLAIFSDLADWPAADYLVSVHKRPVFKATRPAGSVKLFLLTHFIPVTSQPVVFRRHFDRELAFFRHRKASARVPIRLFVSALEWLGLKRYLASSRENTARLWATTADHTYDLKCSSPFQVQRDKP